MDNSPITADWLKQHRVHGDRQQLQALADNAYNELSRRVGSLVAPKLSDQQLAEFEKMMEAGASAESQVAWLDKNYPAYPKIVKAQTKQLMGQLEASIDKSALLKSWQHS